MTEGYIDIGQLRRKHPSFDKEDTVLTRYEMVREYRATDINVSDLCLKFGTSQRQFHTFRARFEEEGILGLADRKSGPKGSWKITPEVEELILKIRRTENLNINEISQVLLERHQIEVSPSAIDEVLTKHGMMKKKRGRKPKKKTKEGT